MPQGKKPRQYYSICSEDNIPKELIEDIRQLYSFMECIEKRDVDSKFKIAI